MKKLLIFNLKILHKLKKHTIFSNQFYLVWSKYGPQRIHADGKWKTASVEIQPRKNFKVWIKSCLTIPKHIFFASNLNLLFQVVFEGVRGYDFHSDIAIDDVKITQGKCSEGCSVRSSQIFCESQFSESGC